jgi:hypothetical protein
MVAAFAAIVAGTASSSFALQPNIAGNWAFGFSSNPSIIGSSKLHECGVGAMVTDVPSDSAAIPWNFRNADEPFECQLAAAPTNLSNAIPMALAAIGKAATAPEFKFDAVPNTKTIREQIVAANNSITTALKEGSLETSPIIPVFVTFDKATKKLTRFEIGEPKPDPLQLTITMTTSTNFTEGDANVFLKLFVNGSVDGANKPTTVESTPDLSSEVSVKALSKLTQVPGKNAQLTLDLSSNAIPLSFWDFVAQRARDKLRETHAANYVLGQVSLKFDGSDKIPVNNYVIFWLVPAELPSTTEVKPVADTKIPPATTLTFGRIWDYQPQYKVALRLPNDQPPDLIGPNIGIELRNLPANKFPRLFLYDKSGAQAAEFSGVKLGPDADPKTEADKSLTTWTATLLADVPKGLVYELRVTVDGVFVGGAPFVKLINAPPPTVVVEYIDLWDYANGNKIRDSQNCPPIVYGPRIDVELKNVPSRKIPTISLQDTFGNEIVELVGVRQTGKLKTSTLCPDHSSESTTWNATIPEEVARCCVYQIKITVDGEVVGNVPVIHLAPRKKQELKRAPKSAEQSKVDPENDSAQAAAVPNRDCRRPGPGVWSSGGMGHGSRFQPMPVQPQRILPRHVTEHHGSYGPSDGAGIHVEINGNITIHGNNSAPLNHIEIPLRHPGMAYPSPSPGPSKVLPQGQFMVPPSECPSGLLRSTEPQLIWPDAWERPQSSRARNHTNQAVDSVGVVAQRSRQPEKLALTKSSAGPQERSRKDAFLVRPANWEFEYEEEANSDTEKTDENSVQARDSYDCCRDSDSRKPLKCDCRRSIRHFVFNSPARFDRPAFDRNFNPSDIDGAVIYENMRFSLCDENGNFELRYCVSTPETVQLRLQLVLCDSESGNFTLTMPARTITYTAVDYTRDMVAKPRHILVRGRAPVLVGRANKISGIARRGTARFGSLPSAAPDDDEPSDTNEATDPALSVAGNESGSDAGID